MSALPDSSQVVAASATEGDVKNWITGINNYLSGLFGNTGVKADALAALGGNSITKTSQLQNDSGFLTSGGSINYANSAGNGVTGISTYQSTEWWGGGVHKYVRVTLTNGGYFDAEYDFIPPANTGGG